MRRALDSVTNQTYKNFEHIIVDDGSTDNPDEILLPYLEAADYPVLYLKKDNGGVHTARNLAVKYARGEYTLFLDSDDEIIPTAIEEFLKSWDEIPAEKRSEYYEVVAFCMDETGKQMGNKFPENINIMTKEQANSVSKKLGGTHMSMLKTSTIQAYPWPEPEGVTFVAESIVWMQLGKQYKKRFLNKCLYIYHTETEISNVKLFKIKTIQHSINDLFRYQYIINNADKTGLTISSKAKNVLLYTIFRQHLKSKQQFPKTEWAQKGLNGIINHLLGYTAYLPALILRKTILKKRFK